MDVEKKIEFVSEASRNIQNLISLADTKANTSLSIQSLLISVGLGTSLLSNTFEHAQKLNNNLSYVFYFIVAGFIISSILGIILSINVYRARLLEQSKQNSKGILYFGQIVKFHTFNDYFTEINNTGKGRILRELTLQVYTLSHIADKKMKSVNLSINFLMLNLFLTIILMLLSGYISRL